MHGQTQIKCNYNVGLCLGFPQARICECIIALVQVGGFYLADVSPVCASQRPCHWLCTTRESSTGLTTRSSDLFRTVINFYYPAGREQGALLLNHLHFSTIHQEFTLTLLKINVFIPTCLRGTRIRLGVKRDVTRIVDNECVITWQSRAWFLTIHNNTKAISWLLRGHVMTHHAFTDAFFLKSRLEQVVLSPAAASRRSGYLFNIICTNKLVTAF
jgi:hypothetical protein